MSRLEKIVKKFNLKTYIIYPLFLTSLIFGCGEKTSPIDSNQQNPPSVINKKPRTTIIKPTNNQTFYSSSVTAEWSGSDEDGKVVGFFSVLSSGERELVFDYCDCNSKTFTNLSEATYSIKVGAKDDKGEYDPNPPEIIFNVDLTVPSYTGRTNSNGYVKLNVNNSTFDVYVKNESDQSLSDIIVSGDYYRGNIYGFLAEDFSLNYLSEIYYTDGFGKSKNNEFNIFMKAKQNNEIRIRKLPDLKDNERLEYLGTTSLSDLKSFYERYDILFNLTSSLEFIVSYISEKIFTASLEAARAREWIINNTTSYGKITNTISSLIGQEWDPDAFYFDVYRHRLVNVVNHYADEDNLCTLKGKVTDSSNNSINGAIVSINDTPLYDYTDSNGNYLIKSLIDKNNDINLILLPGDYTVKAIATNYNPQEKIISIPKPNPPFYKSASQNFQLSSINQQQTIILQPGSEGKDAYVAIIRHPENPCFFYCNDNYGNDLNLHVFSYLQQNQTEHLYRSFLQFDLNQIPANATINSAILYAYGEPTGSHNAVAYLNIKCKEVLETWLENTITWNNQPSLGNSLDSKTIYYDGDFGNHNDAYWESWNITSLAQSWVKNQKPNYGVSLTTDDPSQLYPAQFPMNSSDYSNSSLRPKLVITYTP